MAKTLKEYFKKYLPTPTQDRILSDATITSARVDKEQRIIEAHADFKYLVPKEELMK